MIWNNILKNWKTSGMGTIGCIFTALQLLGYIHLTNEQITSIGLAIASIIGLLAKDGDQAGVAQK